MPELRLRNEAAPLRMRRCVRHVDREAAARCSSCGAFFCRECASEHAGRIVCASCLAKQVRTQTQAKRARWTNILRALQLGVSVMLLWVVFHVAGVLLKSIPADFHDGTIWRRPL